jgi:hypothetical protein
VLLHFFETLVIDEAPDILTTPNLDALALDR